MNAPRFSGWHRPDPGSRWRIVCDADGEAACYQLLAGLVRGGDLLVMPQGSSPMRPPPRITFARGLPARSSHPSPFGASTHDRRRCSEIARSR